MSKTKQLINFKIGSTHVRQNHTVKGENSIRKSRQTSTYKSLVSQLISSSRTYDNNYVFPNKELYITFSWIPLKGKSWKEATSIPLTQGGPLIFVDWYMYFKFQ